jgi:hypothetical protein
MNCRDTSHRLLAAFAWALVLLPVAARADVPRNVRLGYSSPDTAQAVTISWNTDSPNEPSLVQYGKGLTYSVEVEGVAEKLPGDLGYLHEAQLVDLDPGDEYHFEVGGPGKWSMDYGFKTQTDDPCAPVRLIFMGDGRSDDSSGSSPRWPAIIDEAMSLQPDLILNTGDIVKEGKEANQWRHYLDHTDPHHGHVPMLYTIGNHDDDSVEGDGALYNRIFAHPRNSVTQTEDYYYVTLGDVIIVSLSTTTFKGGAYAFQEQADWLDQVLTDNPRTWKFVFFHHPIFTASLDLGFADVGHPPNEAGQNPALIPVFEAHHVDFVFYGHNHFYQRFSPMIGGDDLERGQPVDSPEDGTQYVVSGGAGAFTYVVGMAIMCGITTGSEFCDGNHHLVEIEVDGHDITYTAHRTKAQLLGTSDDNGGVLETFTYTKAGEDLCDSVAPDVIDPPTDVVEEEVTEVEEEPQPETVTPEVEEDTADPEPQPETEQPGPEPAEEVAQDDVPKQPGDGEQGEALEEDGAVVEFETGTKPKPESGSSSGGSCALERGERGVAPLALLVSLLALLCTRRRLPGIPQR